MVIVFIDIGVFSYNGIGIGFVSYAAYLAGFGREYVAEVSGRVVDVVGVVGYAVFHLPVKDGASVLVGKLVFFVTVFIDRAGNE